MLVKNTFILRFNKNTAGIYKFCTKGPLFVLAVLVVLLCFTRESYGSEKLRKLIRNDQNLSAINERRKADLTKLVIVPKTSNKVTINPGMGLVVPTWMNQIKKSDWYMNISKVAYTRWTWAQLESVKGRYKFKKIKQWILVCHKNGLKPAFRIMSSTSSGTATPSYVFEAGAPGIKHKGGKQIDPVYWNKSYLKQYAIFIKALGRALEGGKGLEFIDMGGIGVWGEMHLGLHMKDMWTKEELLKYGYNHEKYFAAYKIMIDVYKRAFPNTTLILNISKFDDIAEYAAQAGVGLRFDGLNPTGKLEHISKIFNKFGLGTNLNRGVPCIYEFAQKYSNPHDVEGCIERILESPITYLHLNLGNLLLVNKDIKKAIQFLAQKIGYRFVLKKIIINKELLAPKDAFLNLSIEQNWINVGIAPCYENYNLVFFLIDNKGKVMLEKVYKPDPIVSKWLPDKNIELVSILNIPQYLPDGKYSLKIAIRDSTDPSLQIELGIDGRDQEGRYTLSILKLETLPNNYSRVLKVIKPK